MNKCVIVEFSVASNLVVAYFGFNKSFYYFSCFVFVVIVVDLGEELGL